MCNKNSLKNQKRKNLDGTAFYLKNRNKGIPAKMDRNHFLKRGLQGG